MVEKLESGEQRRIEKVKADVMKDFFHGKDAKGIGEKDNAAEKHEKTRQAAFGNKLQGDIGEGVSEQVASEKLNLQPDPRFDKPKYKDEGFDTVYRDGNKKPVIVESKHTEREIKSLKGNQMQPEWVEQKAKLMQTPGHNLYTPGNAEIGREIEKIGAENVRRLVITMNPSTMETKVFEGQADHSWKQTHQFSTWDFPEYPTLK
jgi:hypothetical protein